MKISLVEALTGFISEITYLDGKKFAIKSDEGDIISDSMIKKVQGKGLPFFKDAMGHGNLYI
jgi:DnaJ-class molecular chaperone